MQIFETKMTTLQSHAFFVYVCVWFDLSQQKPKLFLSDPKKISNILFVHTTRKKLPLLEVLQTYLLQANANETNSMGIQLRFECGELFRTKAAEGSSKPS